jgi:ABC-type glutathione transport system ATPase component
LNTLESFLEYLDALGDHDLPVAAGLAALCRLADPIGQSPRQAWSAALNDLVSPSGADIDASGPVEDRPGALDDRVAARLEAAQVASREPSEVAWDTLAFRPALWDALHRARDQVQVACDGAVDRLRQDTRERQAEPPTERSRLHAHHLTKIYKKRKVVNDVGIEVSQGEIVGLLGPNGAGKTTTFYMIVGLIPPNSGKVYLDEREITTVPMYKRSRMGVGYLAQEPSVFRKLTVEENVKAILETTKQPRKQRKARLEELLAELSLTHLRDNKAYSLSGGERRHRPDRGERHPTDRR